MLIFANEANWKDFMKLAISKFNYFINDNSIAPLWCYIIEKTKDLYVEEVSSVLDKYADRISLLMSVKDKDGRKAIEIATPKYKDAMLQRFYIFRRYEILDKSAEHMSSTCVVRIARDHLDNDRNVALKFFYKRDQFDREKLVRQNCRFEDKYVVSVLRVHDGDEEKEKILGDEAVRKGYYRYCMVMPAAERNLGTILVHEYVAGRDWDQLRMISKQLIEALIHVHEKGYIHGDVKRK